MVGLFSWFGFFINEVIVWVLFLDKLIIVIFFCFVCIRLFLLLLDVCEYLGIDILGIVFCNLRIIGMFIVIENWSDYGKGGFF